MPRGKVVGGMIALVVMLLLFTIFETMSGGMGYWQKPVLSDEVGIRIVKNEPVEVLGPGVYNDFGPFNWFQYKDIKTIKVNAIPFSIADKEVFTKDRQKLGVLITGNVIRPKNSGILIGNWASYRQYYENDVLLVGKTDGVGDKAVHTPGLMDDQGNQAAKVCIGDKNFDDLVIGSARDVLKECVEAELTKLLSGFGLSVANIVVPNFILSPEALDKLNAITTSRLSQQLAAQVALQNTAEAEQENAKQRGAILVEQGKVQERARQDAATAQLQTQALEAQRAQIDAQKNNELLSAQRDKDIADAQRQAAALKAQAELAPETAKAEMLQKNSAYVNMQIQQAWAAAYNKTDKVITPAGTVPIIVTGDDKTPIIQTAPAPR